MSAPYRRLLWSPEGVEITVCSEAEEAEKVAQGYRLTAAEPVYNMAVGSLDVEHAAPPSDPPTFGPADDGTGEGPTEGLADDDTHEKKPKRKK